MLAKCAATTLSSKLIGGEKEFFATMVVDAVMAIGNDDRLNLIGIKKVTPIFVFLFYKSLCFFHALHIISDNASCFFFLTHYTSMSKLVLCSVYCGTSILPINGLLHGFCNPV